MPITLRDAPSTLHGEAAKTYVGAFNGAYAGTCKNEGDRRDECAARVAWAAVKKKFKKSGDKWVAKSGAIDKMELGDLEATHIAEFIVTKTSSSDGELKWVGRASDTLEDDLGTSMSRTLFMNFIRRAEFFGDPYLGVAHYGELEGFGRAGETTSMWIDGSMFKARGVFTRNSLGLALYGALNKERSTPDLDQETRIRLSLGFLDLKHAHGDFIFERRSLFDECPVCARSSLPDTYLDGILIHFAATRIPVNRRTEIELEGAVVERSQRLILTRQDDARSIVGDVLANELETLSLAQAFSPDVELSDGMVELSASQTEVEEVHTQNLEEVQTMPGELEANLGTEAGESETEEPAVQTETQTEEETPTEAPTQTLTQELLSPSAQMVSSAMEGVGGALEAFSSGVRDVLSAPDLTREERLERLQPLVNTMSQALMDGAEQASSTPQQQMVAAFSRAIRDEFKPVAEQLNQLVMAIGLGGTTQRSGRRTYQGTGTDTLAPDAPLVEQSQAQQPQSRISQLARRSVGLDLPESES